MAAIEVHECEQQLARARKLETDACLQLARLDQEIEDIKHRTLADITSMTDRSCASGKRLFELLLVSAEKERLLTQLPSGCVSSLPDSETCTRAWLEDRARSFVAVCACRAQLCLECVDESLAEDDLSAARGFAQQAQRLIGALQEVQQAWPWSSAAAEEQARRQYDQRQLMSFEAFKHELLRATQ